MENRTALELDNQATVVLPSPVWSDSATDEDRLVGIAGIRIDPLTVPHQKACVFGGTHRPAIAFVENKIASLRGRGDAHCFLPNPRERQCHDRPDLRVEKNTEPDRSDYSEDIANDLQNTHRHSSYAERR